MQMNRLLKILTLGLAKKRAWQLPLIAGLLMVFGLGVRWWYNSRAAQGIRLLDMVDIGDDGWKGPLILKRSRCEYTLSVGEGQLRFWGMLFHITDMKKRTNRPCDKAPERRSPVSAARYRCVA